MPRVRTQADDGTKPLIEYVTTSAGAGDAGKFPILNASGQLDGSMFSASSVQTANAGETIAVGQAITVRNGPGTDVIRLANATDGLNPCMGIAVTGGTTGNPVSYMPLGNPVDTAQASANNTRYFLGLTGGTITSDISSHTTGNILQMVGNSSAIGRLNTVSDDVQVIA